MSDEKRGLRRVMRPRFERRYEEDRTKSDEAGRYMTRPLDIVELTVIGDGRNNAVIEVKEWLANCERMVRAGEMPQDWLDGYKKAYDRFLNGMSAEDIVEGTPLSNWPAIGAAQVQDFIAKGVRTVEELAQVDDASRKYFGPNFVSIQNRAKQWVSSAASLARENKELKARLDALEAKAGGNEMKDLIGV